MIDSETNKNEKVLGDIFDIDSFLIKAREKIVPLYNDNDCEKYANEVSLYYMFLALKAEGFPKYWTDCIYFHKMFRNSDVFNNSCLNLVMYHLIESSNIIWILFYEECEKYKEVI